MSGERVSLFWGEDEPRLIETYKKYIDSLTAGDGSEFNTAFFDGSTVNFDEIISASMTIPFLSDVRVVVVENFSENPETDTILPRLTDFFTSIPETTALIFLEKNLLPPGNTSSKGEAKRKAKRKAFLDKFRKEIQNVPEGIVNTFSLPSDESGMVKWMSDRLKPWDVTIQRDTAVALGERINEDLILADSELQKLSAYVGEGGQIKLEDVELLTPYSADASIFALVDNLGARNGAGAMNLLHRLLEEGDDPLRIFGMIVRQFRLIIQMRELLDSGESVVSAGKIIGISHDFVSKKIARQARMYPSQEYLDRIFTHLHSVDLAMKTGKIDPELALERLLAMLDR